MRLFLVLFLIAGCGTEERAPIDQPNPGPGPGPIDEIPDFARMTEIHDSYCVQCHGGSAFTLSENALRASSAKQRVLNGTMPKPPISMPREVRDEYLSFFSG